MPEAKRHELTICAQAKSWMDQELSARPELVFGRVETEESIKARLLRSTPAT